MPDLNIKTGELRAFTVTIGPHDGTASVWIITDSGPVALSSLAHEEAARIIGVLLDVWRKQEEERVRQQEKQQQDTGSQQIPEAEV